MPNIYPRSQSPPVHARRSFFATSGTFALFAGYDGQRRNWETGSRV
jgi:hypothetical protein